MNNILPGEMTEFIDNRDQRIGPEFLEWKFENGKIVIECNRIMYNGEYKQKDAEADDEE